MINPEPQSFSIGKKLVVVGGGETNTELPVRARYLSRDGGAFDPTTERLLVKTTHFSNRQCLFCSDECFHITDCCGATMCPDCLETEALTHCVNCGDALHSLRNVIVTHQNVSNDYFQGTEPRHLENTGRRPLCPNFGWLDTFGKSERVVVAKKNIPVNNSIWTTISRNDENRIYYGFRPKCV